MNSINDQATPILSLLPLPSMPRLVDVINEQDEEKIIDFIKTYGISAASETFYDQDHQQRLIHIAASQGWTKLVHVLIDLGEQYDIPAENQNGFDLGATPFAFAALNWHQDTMALLLQYGADFNQPFPEIYNQGLCLGFRQSAEANAIYIEEQENPKLSLGEGLLFLYMNAPENSDLKLLIKCNPTFFFKPIPKLVTDILFPQIKQYTPLSSLPIKDDEFDEIAKFNFGDFMLMTSKNKTTRQTYILDLLTSIFFTINLTKLKFSIESIDPKNFEKLLNLYKEDIDLGNKIGKSLLNYALGLADQKISCKKIAKKILSQKPNVKILASDNSGLNSYEIALGLKGGKTSDIAKQILNDGKGFGEILVLQKLVLLRFGTQITIPIDQRKITFNGYHCWITYPEVFNSISSFFLENPQALPQDSINSILKAYWHHVHGTDPLDIVNALSHGRQVIIDTGWKITEGHHAVTVLIRKNQLYMANRGDGSLEGEEGITLYEMDERVNLNELIEVLITKTPKTKEFLCDLQNQPGFTKKILLKHKTQPVGNCPWVSPKTMVRACFINAYLDQGFELKDAVELSRTLYNEWTTFDKIYGINQFLNHPYHQRPRKHNEDEGIVFERVVQECLLHSPKRLKDSLPKHLMNHLDPLQQTLFLNDTEKALKIIESNDFSLTVDSQTSLTSLHLAAHFNHLEIVKAMLKTKISHELVNNIKPSPIELAAKNNHLEIVKQLLPFYSEINSPNHEGKTFLTMACEQFAIEIVEQLVLQNVDFNISDKKGMKPFHLLCMRKLSDSVLEEKRRAICSLLLPKTDLKAICNDGYSILHYAVLSKDSVILEFVLKALIENNYDLNPILPNGLTPLLQALNAKAPFTIIKLLVEAGCNINVQSSSTKRSAIHFALSNDLEDAVKLLLSKGANLTSTDEDGWNALHLAATTRSEANLKEIFNAWQKYGYDTNTKLPDGCTPLHIALNAKNVSISAIKFLINGGCDIHAQSSSKRSAIQYALNNNIEDAVDIFLAKGVDITLTDELGWNALHYAAVSKSEANLKKILNVYQKNGYDINAKSKSGLTPFLMALNSKASEASFSFVQLLIEAGADINAQTNLKQSAMRLALDNNLEGAVDILLSKGVDITLTNELGWNALHCAVISKSEANLKKILNVYQKNGYDINARSLNGLTPLLLAINSNAPLTFVQLLIEAGADINAQSSSKRSALCSAINKNMEDVVRLLLSKDADLFLVDADGWNAFDYASNSGNLIILNMLNDEIQIRNSTDLIQST